jgi:hypothetical protein
MGFESDFVESYAPGPGAAAVVASVGGAENGSAVGKIGRCSLFAICTQISIRDWYTLSFCIFHGATAKWIA